MSATAVGWIVSLIFVVILVGGFFVGFWRGVKKSTANLVFSVIAAIIAFFITPSITGAVLNIQVDNNGQQMTISEYIIDSLMQDENVAVVIERNPNIQTLIEGLPSAIANVVVFLVVMVAIQILIYIVYKIVTCFVFKTKVGQKKHRLFGGLVGLAKVFVITIFAFMPLAGLIGTYDALQSSNSSFLIQTSNENISQNEGNIGDTTLEIDVTDQTDNSQDQTTEDTTNQTTDERDTTDQTTGETENTDTTTADTSFLDEVVPQEVNEILSGLENNMLIKICGIFGLDNATFDYYSKVEVENNTVYIREELVNLYPIANFAYQMTKTDDENIAFADVNYDYLEEFIDKFTEGGLFRSIVVDFLNDIIQNYQKYPFIDAQYFTDIQEILAPIQTTLQEYSQNHEVIENYFTHDIKEIVTVMRLLSENGLLDEIVKTSDVDNIIDLLLSETYLQTTENALINILQLNMVRDAIAPITDIALAQVGDQFDRVDVDTSTWSENDWSNLGSSIVTIANDYFTLSEKVDIMQIVSNPSLLVTDDSIDLFAITSALGEIIDEALGIKLLYTSDGTSILANLLADNNLTLPTDIVYNELGEEVTISSYADLFEFITSSLITVKENDLYELFSGSDINAMLSNLADLLSQEGNENLLSEVILPLYQVEPTKTFLVDELLSTIDTNLVSLASLSSYNEWENDLGYISDLLILTNESTTQEGDTYLNILLNGNLTTLLNEVTNEQLDSILKPIFYAKSTQGIRNDLFDTMIEVVDELTLTTNEIDLSSITLVEGAEEDQAQEICEVFTSFVELNKVYSSDMSIKDIDRTLLSGLLSNLQTNAYRTTLLNKSEEGLFSGIFTNLMATIKSEYQDLISYSQELQDMLDESNYPNIDFTELFDLIEEIESQI